MLKKFRPYIILFYICAVAALVVAVFADLKIDIAINNPSSPFAHTSVLALTRMIMGAHYLSDVTMGGTICFSIVLITMYVIEKKQIIPTTLKTD